MRKVIVALSMTAFTFGSFAGIEAASAATKAPRMSKMGCVIGKQKWDASQGKCVDAKPVAKVAHKASKKVVVKKAM